MIFDASKLSKSGQALLSLGIRVGAIALVAVLDYVSAGLSHGTIQLPVPAFADTIIGLLVAEADTWAIQWETSVVGQ